MGSSETPPAVIKELARVLLESLSSQPNTAGNREEQRKLLVQLRQRHLEVFSEASSDAIIKSDEDSRPKIEELILSLSVVSAANVCRMSVYFTWYRQPQILHH